MVKYNYILLYILLAICVAAIHFPFLDKAFHIDDTLFYYTAEQISKNPLDPYSFYINWRGYPEKIFDFFSNPPGISYYIATIIFIFGSSEKTIHLSFIVFSFISIFSMYFLAKRFTKFPFISALLLVFSPIYMIMSHTIMPDIALLAFLLLSITLFIYGYDQKNILFLIFSGIAASIGILLRYNGLIIIVILVIYYLLHYERYKKWTFTIILFPLLTFLIWNLFSKIIYGNPHFLTHINFQSYLEGMKLRIALIHLMPHLSYLGGGTIFVLFFFLPFFHKNIGNKIIFFILGVYIIYISLYFGKLINYDYLHIFLAGLFLFSIIYFLLILLKDILITYFLKKRYPADKIFLFLWIIAILAMQNSGIHSSAKYMVPAIPALVILLMKDEYWIKINTVYRNILICAVLLFTAMMGLITATADYEFADIGRKISNYCTENIKTGEENTIWFLGHWGFQYYMEEKGFKAYEQNSGTPKKGDFLVASSLAWPQGIRKDLKARLVLQNTVRYDGKIPFKIMHNKHGKHANFYAYSNYGSGYGILPFSFSKLPIDEFKIYQVIAD